MKGGANLLSDFFPLSLRERTGVRGSNNAPS